MGGGLDQVTMPRVEFKFIPRRNYELNPIDLRVQGSRA